MTKYDRAKLADLVALLSGRDFEEKVFKAEIIEDTYKRLSEAQYIRLSQQRFTPLQYIGKYYVKNLKQFDYATYLEDNDGFYSYLYDSSDKSVTGDFYYYSGTFGYYDHLGKFRFIADALVIFDNRKNLGEALINIIGYDELLPLIFSSNRQRLYANDRGFSKLERMKAKTIDDDIYMIEIEIR